MKREGTKGKAVAPSSALDMFYNMFGRTIVAMKILIDRCVERLAVTHVTELVPQRLKWGAHDVLIDVARRAYRPVNGTFFIEELPYLVSLCNLARQRRVDFFTSFELLMEASRQQCSPQGCLGMDLLRGVPMKKVQCPVQRSIVFGGTASAGVTKDDQMEFFRSIQDPRFLQISKATGDAHINDAFHLWTAESAGLDTFLTMDKRFWNVVHNQERNIKTDVLVLTPKQLSERLGLQSTDIERLAADINPFS